MEIIKAESGLTDATGANILQSVNSITLNVASETISITTAPNPSTNLTPNPSSVTPRTGFMDDLGYTNAIIIGTLLILSGLYLFKKKNSDDLH